MAVVSAPNKDMSKAPQGLFAKVVATAVARVSAAGVPGFGGALAPLPRHKLPGGRQELPGGRQAWPLVGQETTGTRHAVPAPTGWNRHGSRRNTAHPRPEWALAGKYPGRRSIAAGG
jgi:hypothetical protein